MPLLSELREFKASFANIGGQKAGLAARKIPFNDLKLPDTEAEPVGDAAPAGGFDTAGDTASGIASGIDDFGFSNLIAQPGDLSVPDIDDQTAMSDEQLADDADSAASPEADNKAAPSADDLYSPPPDELLADFPDGLEPIPPADSLESDNGSGLDNLDNLENFNFPPSPAEPESASADSTPEPAAFTEGAPFDKGADEALDLSVFDDLGDLVSLTDSGDLDLPEEPAPASEGETADLGDLDALDDLGLPEEPAAASEGETADLGDLDALDDLGLPEEPAPASEGETVDLGDLDALDDLGLPEEPAPASEGETADLGDLDALGDLGLPEEPAPASEDETADLGGLDALGDLGLPEESAAASEGETADLGGLDALGDLGLPEEPAPASEDETADIDGTAASGDAEISEEPAPASDSGMPEIGELDDLEIPSGFEFSEETAADDSETQDTDDADLSEESDADVEDELPGVNLGNLDEQVSVDGLVETAAEDAYESFDPASGIGLEKETGEAGSDNIDSLDDIDDFSFPDLDALGGSLTDKKATAAMGKTGKAAGKRKKRSEIDISDDINEIELNDRELGYLQETLAGYPLNLRIACEEIIAEKDVRPEQITRLLRNLIRGAPARETASLASEILERPITVPRGFEKSSVEALEAEKSTFTYIFIHNFLPMLRLFMLISIVAASVFYLTYKFVYIPLKAESIYKMGYERIPDGEYQRANERFDEAFNIHRKKIWFFKYADAFIKERQYIYAEQKYEDLLRYYPRDKLGVLYYAQLETQYLRNYAKADTLLRHQILDYNPNDTEALLALGDNSLAWAEIDPSKYEDARFAYARLLDMHGQLPSIMERMLKYFIRTDNLKEVLPIWQWFNADQKKRPLGAQTLAELGGYLLDKQLEEVRGVPNEYVALIEDVREILLRAVKQDPTLPEPHYHLARYYKNLGNAHEERVTLEIAIKAFDNAAEESIRRLNYRIDTYQRYADNLIDSREFMHAEEQLVKGVDLYKDAISRRLISESPKFGRLYAGLGDLEYFTKTGNMEAALEHYRNAERFGWAPPDMRYRMGAANYQLGNWQSALEHFFAASSELPMNRRILFALGNSALRRGDNFAAQGYYNRLLNILENQRARLPLLLPNDRPEYLDLAERLMMARNNAGVANEKLAAQTGNRVYHTRAMSLYAESERAWDSLTRDPNSMVRSGSTSLPFLNMRNILYPRQNYEPQIYTRIDREALESSRWEQLAPPLRD
jgi:TolA-binding protein